jgi:hypothetical protein
VQRLVMYFSHLQLVSNVFDGSGTWTQRVNRIVVPIGAKSFVDVFEDSGVREDVRGRRGRRDVSA